MAAAEDFETLLVLFSAFPETERPELLDRFLATWEECRSRWGFPRSERLHLVRRYIRSRVPQDFHTLLTLFSAFPEDERPAALDRFLGVWEKRHAERGFPNSRRLHLVRRYIRRQSTKQPHETR